MHLFISHHFDCIICSYVSFNHGRPTENCLSLSVIFLLDGSQGDAYFVDYFMCVSCLSVIYCLVCSLQPCGHLLGKG